MSIYINTCVCMLINMLNVYRNNILDCDINWILLSIQWIIVVILVLRIWLYVIVYPFYNPPQPFFITELIPTLFRFLSLSATRQSFSQPLVHNYLPNLPLTYPSCTMKIRIFRKLNCVPFIIQKKFFNLSCGRRKRESELFFLSPFSFSLILSLLFYFYSSFVFFFAFLYFWVFCHWLS